MIKQTNRKGLRMIKPTLKSTLISSAGNLSIKELKRRIYDLEYLLDMRTIVRDITLDELSQVDMFAYYKGLQEEYNAIYNKNRSYL